MSLVGKVGKFTSKDDKAWGHYYGKECVVLSYDDYLKEEGLLVEFEDRQQLTIGIDEFAEVLS